MNTVTKYLNYMLDAENADAVIPTAADCREALRQLELFPIASGAIETLLKHPGNAEGQAHAKRVLDYLDASRQRAKDLLDKAEPVTNPRAAAAIAADAKAMEGAGAQQDNSDLV